MSDLVKKLERVVEDRNRTPAPRPQVERGSLNAGPANIVEGGYGQDSKPFSLYNFVRSGLACGDWNGLAKHEKHIADIYKKSLMATGCMLPNESAGLWLPINLSAFDNQITSNSVAETDMRYVKSVMANTRYEVDPDEERWLVRKGMIRKAQSAYSDLLGGTLVAPPTMGPVNELIRPEAAAFAAGATTVELPPSGRYVEPRITGAPTAQGLGEGQTVVTSDLTTDQIEMTAKKISGAAIISEESSAFTSGTLDAYVRAELNRTLGLKMDAYFFYGTGGNNIPAGITHSQYAAQIFNVQSQTSPVPRGVGSEGNTLLPEYGDIFEAIIAERSFGMDGQDGAFVMRPGAFASVAAARADAAIPGDKAGPKVDITRRFDERMAITWGQKKVVRTTNILGTTTKTGGVVTNTNTGNLGDVFYGIWKYGLIGTYGAVNFQEGVTNNQFIQGLKTVKATMYGDVAFRHPGAFLYYNAVKGVTALL